MTDTDPTPRCQHGGPVWTCRDIQLDPDPLTVPESDPLAPARGVAVGLVIAGLLWVAVFAAAAIVIARWVR